SVASLPCAKEKPTMNALDTRFTITRRTFLYQAALGLSGIAVFSNGCERRESDFALHADVARCRLFCAFEVNADVPTRMLFPARTKIAKPTQLTSIKCVHNASKILLRFTGDRKIIWDKALSYENSVQQRGGRANREAVAPKLIAAYALHEIAQILRVSRARDIVGRRAEARSDDPGYVAEIDSISQLKRDFEVFQERRVLDAVSVGALYELLCALDIYANSVARVLWDKDNKKFIVSPA
ncbi:MAG: hypothetical protein JSW39_19975, partial [Desulfobacterales bacterium]